MIRPERPADDEQRVEALRSLNLLDTPEEERYDRIVRDLADLLGVSIAYLALMDSDRQWLKSMIGNVACETDRDASFCGHTILEDQPLIVEDARRDPRFAKNPMVVGEPFLRFYAGVPLKSAGHNVGTLCVADRQPRRFSDADLAVLGAFARKIEDRINRRPEIFISYSHRDEEWKDRLVSHLSVLQRQDLLNVWDDRRIEAGGAWKQEIQDAMESSNVAILLVSANFLTSKFILDVEVPRLLNRRDREGLQVLPLVIKPCCWDRVAWLEPMNMYPRDARPLAGVNEFQVDQELARFAAVVLEKIQQAPAAPEPPVRPAATDPFRSAREAGPPAAISAGKAAGLKLLVRDVEGSRPAESFVFRQDLIAIGRDPACDLPLHEDQPVISGRHAEIVARGEAFELRDLGSKNFTYLNDEQLESHRLYEIRPGDRIEIGGFEIRVDAISGKVAPAAVEPTVFDPAYENPFKSDAQLLADVLRRVAEAYDGEAASRRDAALTEALKAALGDDAGHAAHAAVARLLTPDGGG